MSKNIFISKGRVWKVVDQQFGEKASQGAEDIVYTFTVPKEWFQGKDTIMKITAFGTYSQDQVANDFTLKLKAGTTAIVTAVRELAQVATEVGGFMCAAIIVFGDGTAQDAVLMFWGTISKAAAASDAIICERGTGTVDMTAADTALSITVTHETDNAGVFTKWQHVILEILLPEGR